MRIGIGYDIHRLAPGRKLTLGGVTIPAALGEEGHSDGDVLVHAVIDALLGALALGDIGAFFPPTDPRYKDIDSLLLLKETMRLVKNRGAAVVNLDASVILEKPAVAPFRDKVRESLAAVLEIGLERVSVKAKTKEGLDATGRELAVEAFAAVLLET